MQYRIVIDLNRCRYCRECKVKIICPNGAVYANSEDQDAYIEPWCSGCRKCLDICPFGAVQKL